MFPNKFPWERSTHLIILHNVTGIRTPTWDQTFSRW